MEIPISDLRRISVILLDHVEQLDIKCLDLDVDYYWEIAAAERYDPTKDPKDITLGQLYHDWERLSEMLHGESEPLSIGLVWLSSLLRRLGEKVFI